MKRSYYLFPLMAVTALSLSLAACDDKKKDETAATETTETTTEAPAAESVAPTAAINAEGATAYATADGATTAAVFLTLHNPQATADRLVGASTPVASAAELHQTSTDAQGVMQMTKVDAIEIQPGQQVTLEPNGYHIMLTGLSAPLQEGVPFDITLDFENAADVTLPVTVTAPAASTSGTDTMDHSTMGAADTTTDTTTTDESPAPAETTGTDATDQPAESTTTAPAGEATPDTAPTSSAPDASTTAPSADDQTAE